MGGAAWPAPPACPLAVAISGYSFYQGKDFDGRTWPGADLSAQATYYDPAKLGNESTFSQPTQGLYARDNPSPPTSGSALPAARPPRLSLLLLASLAAAVLVQHVAAAAAAGCR
eukprot:XP_001699320.1 predicted protein [Chlamydomonas reinhardtii]